MGVQQWGYKRLDTGRETYEGDGPANKVDALINVRELRDQGIPATLITREIPDFYVTYDQTMDHKALCDKLSCMHTYEAHFTDRDEHDENDAPRPMCRFCNCMDFKFELAEPKQEAAARKRPARR